MNKIIKIGLISLSSIILLFILIVLLLSILFPRELVRKEIEKYATEFLGTEVGLKKLDFNVFTGVELNGFTVKQYGASWQNEYILSLGKVELKYRLLPLLWKKLYIKACVVGDGVINLERNKKGANWDYFLNKFNSIPKDEKKDKKATKDAPKEKEEKKVITKDALPIDIDLTKVGLENVSINYRDTTFFDIPIEAKVTDVILLAKNINVKNNKPFGLTGNVSINLDGGKNILFDSNIKSRGKLKIFDDESGAIFLNGPIDVKLKNATISSDIAKDLFLEYAENLLSGLFGPSVKDMLNDPAFLSKEADKHFENISKNSKEIIDKNLEKINGIIQKKEDLLKYKDQLTKDFDGQLGNALNDIDSKINEIDSKIGPVLDTVSAIPMVDALVNLKSIRNKVKDLKSESENQKNKFYSAYKNNLSSQLNSEISKAIPKNIPTFKEYENEFNSKINYFKNEFYKNVGNRSITSIFSSILPEFDFLDKKWEIKNISTTYYLNKNQSEAKDIKFNSDYLNIDGDFTKRKNDINFLGDVAVPAKILNIDFLSDANFKSKVKVSGDIKKPKVEIVDFPKIDIDKDKIAEISLSVIKIFLGKDYGNNKIVSEVLKKFSINDINEDELKGLLSGIKDKNLANALSEKEGLVSNIDSNIDSIINELKKKVPGLR